MPYNGAIMIRGAYPNELYHHGIKGQKWGVRRFQNPDGTLTAAGKKRYLAYGREGHWDKKEAKEYEKNTRREYAQRKADAAKAAFLYKDYSRQAERAEKRYLNDRRYGTEHDNIHENRKLAEAKDAKARSEFWKEQNREAVKSVKEFVKSSNDLLTKYGKKPLKDVKTKTLKDGQQVVSNKLRTKGEQTVGEALAMAVLIAAGGGAIAGAIYGGTSGIADVRVTKKYGQKVESENKFYNDYYRGIYDAFNNEGIKIRLKDRRDELGY